MSSGSTAQMSSPPAPSFSQPPPSQPARSTPDPFSQFTSPAPRQASPFQFQQSINPQSSGAADLLGGGPARPPSGLAQSTTAAHDDDDWTFSSSVPDTAKDIMVNNTSVRIIFNVSRESDTVLLIKSQISNNTPAPVSELTLQVAVSRVCSIFIFKLCRAILTCYRPTN